MSCLESSDLQPKKSSGLERTHCFDVQRSSDYLLRCELSLFVLRRCIAAASHALEEES
jgi:hypothetical protein